MKHIEQKLLKEMLDYDKDTGVFYWKVNSGSGGKIGAIAGAKHKTGYIRVGIKGKVYQAHRLVWIYIYGYIPKTLDHINHNKSDNRLSNLREVSDSENQRNRSRNHNNTSGVAGVCWNKNACKWQAQIKTPEKNLYLGLFSEFSDAVNARKNAEVLYNFHENNGKDK